MARASLEPSRMTDKALHARAYSLAVQLGSFGFTALKASEVRAMGSELQRILSEIRLRGTQLELPLELGHRQ